MSKTVAVIQARMGACRLPGKMMLWLHGHPVIEWVVRRTASARLIDDLVVAIPDTPSDDVLEWFVSTRLNTKVFRGSEQDVLNRFVLAGQQAQAETVVRVCADNPFISGEVLDDLIRFFQDNHCDYAYNQGNSGRTNTYPDGLGAEVVSYATLMWLDRNVTEPAHREHCLSYITDSPEQFNIKTFNPPDPRIAYPQLKLDLDNLDDYRHLTLKSVSITSNSLEIVNAFLEDK